MGIHSKVWGQYLWRTLHSMTYAYDPKMPDDLKEKFEKLFTVLKDFIPCPICREHYRQRFIKNPPSSNMRSTEQFVLWLNNLHNEVNAGLGKPLVSIRDANIIYVRDGRLTYDFRDFIILFKIIPLMKNVNYPAVRKFLLIFFEIYPEGAIIKKTPISFNNINLISNNDSLKEWINSFENEFYGKGPVTAPSNTSSIKKEIKKATKTNSKLIKTDIQEFLKKYKLI